jgi:hypothetical protein
MIKVCDLAVYQNFVLDLVYNFTIFLGAGEGDSWSHFALLRLPGMTDICTFGVSLA